MSGPLERAEPLAHEGRVVGDQHGLARRAADDAMNREYIIAQAATAAGASFMSAICPECDSDIDIDDSTRHRRRADGAEGCGTLLRIANDAPSSSRSPTRTTSMTTTMKTRTRTTSRTTMRELDEDEDDDDISDDD